MATGLITSVRQRDENGSIQITVTVVIQTDIAGEFSLELVVPGPLERVKSQTQKVLYSLGSELAASFDGILLLT